MLGECAISPIQAHAQIPSSISVCLSRPSVPSLRHTTYLGCTPIAGAGGGLVASIATCPLDVVKTKLQAQQVVSGQKGYEGVVGEGFS